jgi:hypothetical protein
MKTFISLIIVAVLCLPCLAVAGSYSSFVPFSAYSAASGTAVKSSAVNVRGYNVKTVTVQGIAVAGHTNATLSGTVLVECAPTSAGPWNTCIANNYAQTAVSLTANGTQSWESASAYIRASWAKTAGEVSVWLNWQE